MSPSFGLISRLSVSSGGRVQLLCFTASDYHAPQVRITDSTTLTILPRAGVGDGPAVSLGKRGRVCQSCGHSLSGYIQVCEGRQGRKKGNRNPIRRSHDSLRPSDKPPPGYHPSGRRRAQIGGNDSSHLRMPTDIGKDQRQACTAYPRHQPHHQRLLLGAGQNQIPMAILEARDGQIDK